MSSTAQPVTGIDPEMPVALSAGVSNAPCGAVACALLTTFSVTLTGPAVLPAPLNVSVTVPACVEFSADTKFTEIFRVAEPEPDAGETESHDGDAVAVQVTVPVPVWVRRTAWADVFELKAAPVLTALKMSEVLSRLIVGPVPA